MINKNLCWFRVNKTFKYFEMSVCVGILLGVYFTTYYGDLYNASTELCSAQHITFTQDHQMHSKMNHIKQKGQKIQLTFLYSFLIGIQNHQNICIESSITA